MEEGTSEEDAVQSAGRSYVSGMQSKSGGQTYKFIITFVSLRKYYNAKF